MLYGYRRIQKSCIINNNPGWDILNSDVLEVLRRALNHTWKEPARLTSYPGLGVVNGIVSRPMCYRDPNIWIFLKILILICIIFVSPLPGFSLTLTKQHHTNGKSLNILAGRTEFFTAHSLPTSAVSRRRTKKWWKMKCVVNHVFPDVGNMSVWTDCISCNIHTSGSIKLNYLIQQFHVGLHFLVVRFM